MPLNLTEFASTRGFTSQELEQWGVHVEGDTIIIPTPGRNGVWYERIHRPGGTPKYQHPKGATLHLFNPLGLGPQSPEVWLAEGEFDTLSLVAAGIPACGILGTEAFNRHWALLFDSAEIVLALDPDMAGRLRADKLAQLWSEDRVTRFDPSPYADLNDWFCKDRKGFEKAVWTHGV